MKKLNRAACAFAALTIATLPFQALGDDAQTSTPHPLVSPINPSLQEIYAIVKFMEASYLVMNTQGSDITSDALIDALITGDSIEYNEDILERKTYEIMRGYYRQEDVTNMSVVCGDFIPTGAIATAHGALNNLFGRPILNQEQITTVMDHFMDVPAGFYLGLHEAEYQQRQNELDPDDAFCKGGMEIVSAVVEPPRP
jgi:hypothetical protein